MISITVSPRVAHNALRVAWLLLTGGILIPTWHQPWWVQGLAMIPTFLGTVALILGAVGHRPEECPRCKVRPKERLRRPHYRLWKTFGLYGWVVLAAVIAAWMVMTAFDRALVKHDGQTLPALVAWTVMIALGILYASARRFVALNYGFARPRPIRTFVQEHCLPLMHRSEKLIIGALVVNLAALAFLPRKGPLSLVGDVLSMALIAAVYLSMRHSATLCEICVEGVYIPADAAEQAARYRYRFTLVHRSAPVMPLVLLVSVIGPYFLSHLGDVILQAVLDAVLVAGMLLANYHSAWQPWCPYCRGDDGPGDGGEVPDPTPDQGRPLPV